IQPAYAPAEPGDCIDYHVEPKSFSYCALADDGEIFKVSFLSARGSEDAGVRNIQDHPNLVPSNTRPLESLLMRLMYRNNAVREPRAGARFVFKHTRAKSPPTAAEFVAVQLRHRIMNIQHDFAAEHFRRERTEHRNVGNRADQDDIVAMRVAES